MNGIRAHIRVDRNVAAQRAQPPLLDLATLRAKYAGDLTKVPQEDLLAIMLGLSAQLDAAKTETVAALSEQQTTSALLAFANTLDVEMTDRQLADKLGDGIISFLGSGQVVDDVALEHRATDERNLVTAGDRIAVPIVDSGVVSVVVLEKVGGFSDADAKTAARFAQQLSKKRVEANRTWTEDLTSLMTRKAFTPVAKQMTKDALDKHTPLHLFFFDIDCFHAYNEHHGHMEANKVMRVLGDVVHELRTTIPGAVACRFGGEEFVLLAPALGDGQALELGEKLRTTIHRQTSAKFKEGVTVSVGVSSIADKTNWVELITAGDEQQYRAKGRQGKGSARGEQLDFSDAGTPKNQVSMEMRKSLRELARAVGISEVEADALLKTPALGQLLSSPRFAHADVLALLRDPAVVSLLKALSLSPSSSTDVHKLPKEAKRALELLDVAREQLAIAQGDRGDQKVELPEGHPARRAFGLAAAAVAGIVHKRFASIAEGVTRADRLARWDELCALNEVANGKVGHTAFLVDKVIPQALSDPRIVEAMRKQGVSEREMKRLPSLFAEAARLQSLGECVSAAALLGAPRQLNAEDRKAFVEGMPVASAKYAASLELTGDPAVVELLGAMRYGNKRGDPIVALFDMLIQTAAFVHDRPHRPAMPVEKAQVLLKDNCQAYAPELADIVATRISAWMRSWSEGAMLGDSTTAPRT